MNPFQCVDFKYPLEVRFRIKTKYSEAAKLKKRNKQIGLIEKYDEKVPFFEAIALLSHTF